MQLAAHYAEIIKQIQAEAPFKPETGIILGSGLGDFAEKLELVKSISTAELHGYPVSTVAGHQGKIHFARYEGKQVLVFQGRVHFYEGYTMAQCLLPVEILVSLGCRNLLLTNAAGGVNRNFSAGDLMLVTDAFSINIKKELSEVIGAPTPEEQGRITGTFSAELKRIIRSAALQEQVLLREGTYWYNKGPMYETPAEINMIAGFGGDAVGMSSVHEAVYGAKRGMRVGCISCITNMAAGISGERLSHEEVTETANRVKFTFERLIKRIITLL